MQMAGNSVQSICLRNCCSGLCISQPSLSLSLSHKHTHTHTHKPSLVFAESNGKSGAIQIRSSNWDDDFVVGWPTSPARNLQHSYVQLHCSCTALILWTRLTRDSRYSEQLVQQTHVYRSAFSASQHLTSSQGNVIKNFVRHVCGFSQFSVYSMSQPRRQHPAKCTVTCRQIYYSQHYE